MIHESESCSTIFSSLATTEIAYKWQPLDLHVFLISLRTAKTNEHLSKSPVSCVTKAPNQRRNLCATVYHLRCSSDSIGFTPRAKGINQANAFRQARSDDFSLSLALSNLGLSICISKTSLRLPVPLSQAPLVMERERERKCMTDHAFSLANTTR